VQNKQETSVKFLISLGATVNAVNDLGMTCLHEAVIAENLRICKDLCVKGADRNAKNQKNETPLDLAKLRLKHLKNFKSFESVLSKQLFSRCPFYKLPYMPVERNKVHEIIFLILFVFIWVNNVFVIEPVLDVYYFMVSTTLCMVKLAITYGMMCFKEPGYVEQDAELDWLEVMKKVPSKYLCLECKVVRPPRSVHCSVCNKCVDRYEAHSFWTNSCVGR